MAEQFKTIREVGIAIDGLKTQVLSQFGTFKWIATSMGGVGIVVAGLLFNNIGGVSKDVNALAKLTARMDERQQVMNTKLAGMDMKLDAVIARLDNIQGGINKINAGVTEMLDCQKANYAVSRGNSVMGLAAAKKIKAEGMGVTTFPIDQALTELEGEISAAWGKAPWVFTTGLADSAYTGCH